MWVLLMALRYYPYVGFPLKFHVSGPQLSQPMNSRVVRLPQGKSQVNDHGKNISRDPIQSPGGWVGELSWSGTNSPLSMIFGWVEEERMIGGVKLMSSH